MTTEKSAKGPASYSPSIEKTYGKPISHRLAILDAMRVEKHMEKVSLLKSEYGMGHGHAKALVAYRKAPNAT